MIYSTMTEYAIRGLSEMAARSGGSSMMLDQLVKGTGLPRDYLAKVFQKLVRAGILTSAKGRNGGFALARATHEISLLDVVNAIEEEPGMDRCVIGLDRCNDQMPCPEHDLYKPIRQRLADYLRTTTLADLAASLKTKSSWAHART